MQKGSNLSIGNEIIFQMFVNITLKVKDILCEKDVQFNSVDAMDVVSCNGFHREKNMTNILNL